MKITMYLGTCMTVQGLSEQFETDVVGGERPV